MDEDLDKDHTLDKGQTELQDSDLDEVGFFFNEQLEEEPPKDKSKNENLSDNRSVHELFSNESDPNESVTELSEFISTMFSNNLGFNRIGSFFEQPRRGKRNDDDAKDKKLEYRSFDDLKIKYQMETINDTTHVCKINLCNLSETLEPGVDLKVYDLKVVAQSDDTLNITFRWNRGVIQGNLKTDFRITKKTVLDKYACRKKILSLVFISA